MPKLTLRQKTPRSHLTLSALSVIVGVVQLTITGQIDCTWTSLCHKTTRLHLMEPRMQKSEQKIALRWCKLRRSQQWINNFPHASSAVLSTSVFKNSVVKCNLCWAQCIYEFNVFCFSPHCQTKMQTHTHTHVILNVGEYQWNPHPRWMSKYRHT